MSKGLIISLSGIDGAGKSTQIKLLEEYFGGLGRKPIYLWNRVGYGQMFEALKAALRRGMGSRLPARGDVHQHGRFFRRHRVRSLWITLALLDHLRLYSFQVRLRRLRGHVVICDRYLWDALIDLRINFPEDRTERRWLWRLLQRLTPAPDLALLLAVPVEESARRSDIKGDPFREPPDTLARRAKLYEELTGSAAWHVLDGTKPPHCLFQEIVALMGSPVGAVQATATTDGGGQAP